MKTREWSARGLVLSADENGFDARELFDFARRACDEFPAQPVQVGEFGVLRVTEYRDSTPGCGPRLDWRD